MVARLAEGIASCSHDATEEEEQAAQVLHILFSRSPNFTLANIEIERGLTEIDS